MPADKLMKKNNAFAAIPFNPSSQKLMPNGNDADGYSLPSGIIVNDSNENLPRSRSKTPNHITRSQWFTVIILFFVNLINYMDRLTIAGILSKIQNEFQIGDAEGGALQTAFVVFYMIFAPIFGYLGDRRSRTAIMVFGVSLWSIFTVLGSFMTSYQPFLLCRAIVGIGEASYSTIAPTIISDLFVKEIRSKMLALFYFAIPVGSGLGYVVGAGTTNLAGGDWRWGLRVTPILGLIAVLLMAFFMEDPPRGDSEGHGNMKATSYKEDLKSLASNGSFVFSTFALTSVAFCTGALSWWGPNFIKAAIASMPDSDPDSLIKTSNVSFVFGVVTMLSGIIGVPLGSILSTKLTRKYPRADPIICGIGLFVSAVFLTIAMFLVEIDVNLAFLGVFLGEIALNLNWAIVADILLYVVIPTRRSTAEAVQILISHAFGDAGSPYLIGIVSDALRNIFRQDSSFCDPQHGNVIPDLKGFEDAANDKTLCDFSIDFNAMRNSLFINQGVEILGGFFFLVTALFIVKDKMRCDRIIAEAGGPESVSMSTDDDDDAPQLKPIYAPIDA